MSIWSFKREGDLDGRLIKHKDRLSAYGGMNQWGANYWEIYPPVVNWMSVRSMLNLNILRELHTKSIDVFLVYTQADVKTEIFMELTICFGV